MNAPFALFEAGHKTRLFVNIAAAMSGVPEDIVERQVGLFHKFIQTAAPPFAPRWMNWIQDPDRNTRQEKTKPVSWNPSNGPDCPHDINNDAI